METSLFICVLVASAFLALIWSWRRSKPQPGTVQALTRLRLFFIWCSGAHMDAVRRAPVSASELSKVGQQVLISTVMVAGGWTATFYISGQPLLLALAAGAVFGALMFVLERANFRAVAPLAGDVPGGEKRRWSAWLLLSARLSCAVATSYLTANSIVMYMASREIHEATEMVVATATQETEVQRDAVLKPMRERRDVLRQERSDSIAKLESEVLAQRALVDAEVAGTAVSGKTSGKRGKGAVAEQLQSSLTSLSDDLARAKTEENRELSAIEAEIVAVEADYRRKAEQQGAVIRQGSGFIGSHEKLERLLQASTSAWLLERSLSVLLLAIELSGWLATTFRTAGPYDLALRRLSLMHSGLSQALDRRISKALGIGHVDADASPSSAPQEDDDDPLRKQFSADIDQLAAAEWQVLMQNQRQSATPAILGAPVAAGDEPPASNPPADGQTIVLTVEMYEDDQPEVRHCVKADMPRRAGFPVTVGDVVERLAQHLAKHPADGWQPHIGWLGNAYFLLNGQPADLLDQITEDSHMAIRIVSKATGHSAASAGQAGDQP